MRVSGQKLRLAVGTGIAALMLTLGVSSVGATAPSSVGLTNIVVVGGGASASGSNNPTVTNTTYRDAVRVTNSGLNGPTEDGCAFRATGDLNNATNTSTVSLNNCSPILNIQPAAYPLWEVQTGTTNVLVVPPTGNGNIAPAKSYVIETFR